MKISTWSVLVLIVGLTGVIYANGGSRASAPVVVINPIEVPEGRKMEALEIWDRYAEYFRRQPGYLGTTLHESLDPTAKFTLINVARWESTESFMASLNSDALKSLGEGFPEDMPHYPSLYQIIRN